jgi:hypothetical protein
MLIVQQRVSSRKTYSAALNADDDAEHPVSGKPEWKITEHRGSDGSPSVRPLAEIIPSIDGHSATVHTFAWPGAVEIEVSAHAPHPLPIDPTAMPRTTRFTERLVIVIPAIPDLAETLALRITPQGTSR